MHARIEAHGDRFECRHLGRRTSTAPAAAAQSQQMEPMLMVIKHAQDASNQKLAQYTWQETETINIKGSVKDTN